MTPSTKNVALVSAAILAVAGGAGYMAAQYAMHHGPTLSSYGNEVGGSFRLMDATTGTMTDQTFHGRWMVVLFGATHCAQDACEPALRNMSAALDQVDPSKRNAVIIFISLDPDRDDADHLREYGAAIGPRVVAGTAAPLSLVDLAKEYHAPIEKVDDPEWTYTMKMSPRFVIMDPNTRYRGTVDANQSTQDMAAHLATIMKKAD
ncbi:electron transport transmembrane protein Sco1/SenC/PrrC [Acetobacter indonesiensis NRIC 0313]|jgi:protein SCO1/2|uniref:Electron transport transmembrane protein Sco1/SenC/PrrC n=1 Tax=Acetobacter indonesiensis TaxID=104101 RepID=A0A6N3T7V6_9PROT|nr:SCO family protein [Acetobacter indonesiensis]MCI1438610.1 SCO family protein [Acetobacter indonesiensis]MCI1547100.1 SCO family protein [Acetobacter indonesiensis]MCI1766452.1 SCO family protein [Acetobacter indonesiensis]GAN62540.1 electron transport transmembrane protein Sco1/SenC/PrrC [Acetobacter indonesiensis]GBQ55815.1 electron transport transmembrane protein Sco1/SenC/PrrC [Acetobacter indonesiensis NRIC 0313]